MYNAQQAKEDAFLQNEMNTLTDFHPLKAAESITEGPVKEAAKNGTPCVTIRDRYDEDAVFRKMTSLLGLS